jgi:hypothetical protein
MPMVTRIHSPTGVHDVKVTVALKVKVTAALKLKQFRYRSGVAQRVPGS